MISEIQKRLPKKEVLRLVDKSCEAHVDIHSEGMNDLQKRLFKFLVRKYRAKFNRLLETYKDQGISFELRRYADIFGVLLNVRSCLRRDPVLEAQLPLFAKDEDKNLSEDCQKAYEIFKSSEENLIADSTKAVIHELYRRQIRRIEPTDHARATEVTVQSHIAKKAHQVIEIIRNLEPHEPLTREYLRLHHSELFDELRRLVSDNNNAPEDWSKLSACLPKTLRTRCQFNDEELKGINDEYLRTLDEYRHLAGTLGPEILADVLVAMYHPHLDFKRALSIIPRYLGKVEPTFSTSMHEFNRLPVQLLERPNVKNIIYIALRRKIVEQITEELDSQPINAEELHEKGVHKIEQEHAERVLQRVKEICESVLDQEQTIHWEFYLRLYREFKYVLNHNNQGMRVSSKLKRVVKGKGNDQFYRAPSLVQRILMNEMTKLGSQSEGEEEYKHLKGILFTLSMGKGKTLGSFLAYEKMIENKLNDGNRMIYVCPDETLANEIAAQFEEHYQPDHRPSTFVFNSKVTPKMLERGVLNQHQIIIIPYSMLASFREIELSTGETQNIRIARILGNMDKDLIVIDEPQNADKPTKPYTMAVRELVQAKDTPFLMLSGTPAPNGPQDLAPQLALARPDLFADASSDEEKQAPGFSPEDLKGVTMKRMLKDVDPIIARAAFAHFNLCLESPQRQWMDPEVLKEPSLELYEDQAILYDQIVSTMYSVSHKMGNLYYALMNPRILSPNVKESVFVDRAVDDLSEAFFKRKEGAALITESFRRRGILTRFGTPELKDVPTYIEQVQKKLEKKHPGEQFEFKILHGDIKNRLTREYLLDWARFPECDVSIKIFQFIRSILNCDQELLKTPGESTRIKNARSTHMSGLRQFLASHLTLEQQNAFAEKNIENRMRELIASGSKYMRAFRRKLKMSENRELHDFLLSLEPPQTKRVLCSMERIIREGINLFEVNTMIKNGFGFRLADDAQMVKRVLREGTPAIVFMYNSEGRILEGIRLHKLYKQGLADRMIYGGTLEQRDLENVEAGDFAIGAHLENDGYIIGSRISDQLYRKLQRINAMNRALEQKGEELHKAFLEKDGEDYATISKEYWSGSESEMSNRVVSSILSEIKDTEGQELTKVADIGAGLKALENTLGISRPDIRIQSFDLNVHMLEAGTDINKDRLQDHHIESENTVCGISAIKAKDESFDAVNCAHVLHYLSCYKPNKKEKRQAERAQALMEINRILKPGGVLTLSLPLDVCTKEQVILFTREMKNFGFEVKKEFSGEVVSTSQEQEKTFGCVVMTFTKTQTVSNPEYNYANLKLHRKVRRAGHGKSLYNDQVEMYHRDFHIDNLNKSTTELHYHTSSVEESQRKRSEVYTERVKEARDIIQQIKTINNNTLENLSEVLVKFLEEAEIKLMSILLPSGKQRSRKVWFFSIDGNTSNLHTVEENIDAAEYEAAAPEETAEEDEESAEKGRKKQRDREEERLQEWQEDTESEDNDADADEVWDELIEGDVIEGVLEADINTPWAQTVRSLKLGRVDEEGKNLLKKSGVSLDYTSPVVIDLHGEKILTQIQQDGKIDRIMIFDVQDKNWTEGVDDEQVFSGSRRKAQLAQLPEGEVLKPRELQKSGIKTPQGSIKPMMIANPEKFIYAGGADTVLTVCDDGKYYIYEPLSNTWKTVSRKHELADLIRGSRAEKKRNDFLSDLGVHERVSREALISSGISVDRGITDIMTVPAQDGLRKLEIVGLRDRQYWVLGRRSWEQVTDPEEIEYFRLQRSD